MKKRIGITGGDGTLGHCIKDVINHEEDFELVSFKGDIRLKTDIKSWIDANKFDTIFHLASIVPTEQVNRNIELAWNVNVVGTANIAEAIIENGNVINLLYTSTSHVYEPSIQPLAEQSKLAPKNLYGLSKQHAEQILELFEVNKNLKVTICRIFSFTSIYQRQPYFIPSIIDKIINIKEEETLELGSLEGYRDFLDGHDVARALLHVFKKNFIGTINICSGQKILLRDILKICLILLKKENVKLLEAKPNEDHITMLCGNNTKLRNLGFQPDLLNIEQILFKYVNFILKKSI